MHTSPASPAIRTATPSLLDEMPPDIFRQIVVTHISLREGRAMSRLACVSRAFAQRMKPYVAPLALRLYRTLENASQASQAKALEGCTRTLDELPLVNPAHRLELFLHVSTVLGNHFSGQAFEPHIDTLLAGMQHVPQVDQPAALLSIVRQYSTLRLYVTQPRYMKMASHIRSLPPSAAQVSLTEMLGGHIPDGEIKNYAKRTQVFLDTCMQLQPAHRAQVLSNLLHFIIPYPEQM
jgi:hypothetical protein